MKKSNLNKLISALKALDKAYYTLEEIINDEQDTFDGRSEKWQESEKGEELEAVISALEDIRDTTESAKDEAENILSDNDIDPWG